MYTFNYKKKPKNTEYLIETFTTIRIFKIKNKKTRFYKKNQIKKRGLNDCPQSDRGKSLKALDSVKKNQPQSDFKIKKKTQSFI